MRTRYYRRGFRHWLLTIAIIGAPLAVASLRGEETNALQLIQQLQERLKQLEQKVRALERGEKEGGSDAKAKQQVEALDQKVRVLERQRELDEEANEAKAKETPRIVVGENGFSLGSPNGNFALQLKGVLQVDSRTFFEDGGTVGNDGILLRRARPVLQGTVYKDFDFQFVPDFGGASAPQIFDAYVNYRYRPELQLQAGKFKTPVGLEQLQADRDIFFNERALPTDLVPNRDLGFELHGDLLGGTVSYAAGIFNGVGDARNSNNADFEDDKAFAGRLFFQPFKNSTRAWRGFGFGVGGSYEDMQATNTTGLPATTGGSGSSPPAGYATVGQQQFFAYTNGVTAAGEHWRLSPQGYYYYGPFGLLGEYVISDQKVSRAVVPFGSRRLDHAAWQLTGTWVLTGEDASYSGIVPRRPFNPAKGNWGAWQLVARYSELDIDRGAFPLFADPAASARTAQEWAVGVNWYLNRNVRINGSSPTRVSREGERVGRRREA